MIAPADALLIALFLVLSALGVVFTVGRLVHDAARTLPLDRAPAIAAVRLVVRFRRRSAQLRLLTKVVFVAVGLVVYLGLPLDAWWMALVAICALDLESFLDWRTTLRLARLLGDEPS